MKWLKKTLAFSLILTVSFGIILYRAGVVDAAIALDTHKEGTSATCNLTNTITNYTVTGTNPVLVVYVLDTSNVAVSRVTYGAASLTKVNDVDSGSSVRSTAWVLNAPTTGSAQTITATLATSATCNLAAVSFSGVNQTTPVDASSTTSVLATTITGSVTTNVSNDVLTDFVTEGAKKNGLTPSLNGATKIASSSVSTTDFADSYTSAVSPAGSYSIKWTPAPSGTINFGENLVALCPSGTSGCGGGGGGGGGSDNSCYYSGSGDWDIKYSDNCVATTTTIVQSGHALYLINNGAGSFQINTGVSLSVSGTATKLLGPINIILDSTGSGFAVVQ